MAVTGDTAKLKELLKSFGKLSVKTDLTQKFAMAYMTYMLATSSSGRDPYGKAWPKKRSGGISTLGSLAIMAASPDIGVGAFKAAVSRREVRILAFGGGIPSKARLKRQGIAREKAAAKGKKYKGKNKIYHFGGLFRRHMRIPARPFMIGKVLPAGLRLLFARLAEDYVTEKMGA